MKRYAKLAARLRVPSGFLAAALYAAFSRPTRTSLVIGLPLALAGLLLRAWAAGHLAKNERLAITGPFADRKSTRLNSSHIQKSRMPSSA